MIEITGKNAPSTSVVIPHFIYGTLALLSACILIVIQPDAFTSHYFNYRLLSITHLLVLGWVTIMIFGVLYQLLPVIIETNLYSERLAKINFYLMTSGIVLLTIGFWHGWIYRMVIFAGSIILLSILIFSINILLTWLKVRTKNIAIIFIGTAVFWLLLTALAGLLAAINLIHPFLEISHLEWLKMHAHAGVIGWFILLVIGVASKLFPMFLVIEVIELRPLKISYVLINVGLLMGLITKYYQSGNGTVIAVVIGFLGLFAFIIFVYQVFVNRIKKVLDTGMKQTQVAFYFLLLAIILLVWAIRGGIADDQTNGFSIAYVTSVVIGFITTLIMAQTYKTLPFIIWLKKYQHKVGKEKTPLPRNLYVGWIANGQVITFSLGFLILISGILIDGPEVVRIGGIIIVVAVLFYGYNVFKIVTHRAKKGSDLKRENQEAEILDLLKRVIDPELMVNIVDLGLVYSVKLEPVEKKIYIEMTLSSKACPLGDAIIANVTEVLQLSFPDHEPDIQLVWEPLWSPAMVTEKGRKLLGGIN